MKPIQPNRHFSTLLALHKSNEKKRENFNIKLNEWIIDFSEKPKKHLEILLFDLHIWRRAKNTDDEGGIIRFFRISLKTNKSIRREKGKGRVRG